jgi:hypothetical protein
MAAAAWGRARLQVVTVLGVPVA